MSRARERRAVLWKWGEKSKGRLRPTAEDGTGNSWKSPKEEGRVRLQGRCAVLADCSAHRIKREVNC